MPDEIPATVTEAAQALGRSTDTVRRLCDRGDLASIRLSTGTRLIDRKSLDELVKR